MANDETRELANLAEVFKALGHPTRLWIAKNLEGKELCVCDFVTGTCDKRGKHVFYRLAYPCIPWMIRFMEARDEFNRLSPEEKNVCMEQQRKQLIDHLMQLKG